MIGTLLYEKITGNPEIAAIIASRMYPVALPQTPTVPAVVYFFDNATSTLSHSGPSGLESATLRVDSWADNFDEAKNLAAKIKEILNGWKKNVPLGAVQGTFFKGEKDIFDEDKTLYSTQQTYLIHYTETQ
jgi:hypothetical protein